MAIKISNFDGYFSSYSTSTNDAYLILDNNSFKINKLTYNEDPLEIKSINKIYWDWFIYFKSILFKKIKLECDNNIYIGNINSVNLSYNNYYESNPRYLINYNYTNNTATNDYIYCNPVVDNYNENKIESLNITFNSLDGKNFNISLSASMLMYISIYHLTNNPNDFGHESI